MNYGTLYEAIGGAETIEKLVNTLYFHVSQNELLMEIFPEDLEETVAKQTWFMTQFLGGPPLFFENRGHPMLRRRHLPFEITPARRDEWVKCFAKGLEAAEIEEPYHSVILERVAMTATNMINTEA